MNLIPTTAGTSLNYWCTWATQNFGREDQLDEAVDASKFEGDQGAQLSRNYLNEEIVFGENGWIHQFPEIRSDLYFMFDYGWDVPYNDNSGQGDWVFGSLELSEERFPSCSGIPEERLKKLNDKVKSYGWKGAGLWIAAQAIGDGENGVRMEEDLLEPYWCERLRWSREAGIEYWKVDLGARADSLSFREWLTELGRREAPNLRIEHAVCVGPLNNEQGSGHFAQWGEIPDKFVSAAQFSDVFRSYDVLTQTSVATTLDRLAYVFQHAVARPDRIGIVNCEDEVYIGAVLGCSIGIMRSTYWIAPIVPGYCPQLQHKRMAETTRAVHWQRIAPNFGLGEGQLQVSNEILQDTWFCEKGDTWAGWLIGKEVLQHAPAVLARGMECPTVQSEGEAPFVIASKHPNGAIAIATLPRTTKAKGIYYPIADIKVNIGEGKHPIGVFGEFGSLTLEVSHLPEEVTVWAQDLCSDQALDITKDVVFRNGQVIIPGELLQRIGTLGQAVGDISDPGLVLVLE
ncbi:hypothetical protein [Cohnella abietis]|uniref:Alpha-galactosidase n=1 Tax=Cohnella abietis TaxID=2507935 RepID=A0A3T1D3T1_9BACL|nr:hypothetical protein [Cohnella abietis]BBI32763.1 hypothetical protein KCTCHS21_21620 [Cohnella abietis]